MGKVTVSREMQHDVASVWSALADFGGIYRFSAGVESSPIIEGTPTEGVGAERNCVLYDGNFIKERVTESIERRALAIEVVETSMPMKSVNARFEVSETSSGGARVDAALDYVVKYGIVGKALNVFMMERMLTKSFNNLLAALDEHLRTGELIEKGWQPARAA